MSTQDKHMARHSAHEDDETTVLPRLPADAEPDSTAIIPALAGEPAGPVAELTGILPVFIPAPRVAEPPLPAPRRRGVADVVRLVARSAGEVLITFGVVVLLLAAYEIWGKGAIIHDHQNALNNQLSQAWGNPAVGPSTSAAPGAPPPGWAIGRLYVPVLKLQWVVVEGVDLKDIRYAPGHYPGTAMPGQLGNFSVAGHREPGMFWDLDRVHPGDDLIVETKTSWYVYQVFQSHIVTPHSVEVVAAVPNKPGASPSQKDMTLTTCNPKWDNYQRLAVHATLVATYPHGVRPAQLGA
jgi:sortase A